MTSDTSADSRAPEGSAPRTPGKVRRRTLPYTTALLTGATGGIGTALARRLAALGCQRLILVARRQAELETLAASLRAEHDVHVEVLVADLTDPTQLSAVADRLGSRETPVDLLVNIAGCAVPGPFADTDIADYERVLALNVTAVLRLTRAALTPMITASRGGVLNVSSLAGGVPFPRNATYAASKAFITSFTESLRTETRGTGVHVTALCPGFTTTPFFDTNDIHPNRLATLAKAQPSAVARAGIAALIANRPLVVPTLRYKLAAVVGLRLPRTMLRFIGNRLLRT